MNAEELSTEIDALLKSLRRCDTQATAVAWMTRAYKAMECSLKHLQQPEQPRLLFVPQAPKLEIVQSIPSAEKLRAHRYVQTHKIDTVIYPNVFLPPGLKPLPKPWTRDDTRRLQAAAEASYRKPLIQRRGK